MKEVVSQSDYEKEMWRRTQLEEMVGVTACIHFGKSVSEYAKNTDVQLEFDYGKRAE